MTAVTGDAPEMEGSVAVLAVRDAVQAAVAFYPPTNFLAMDAWAVRPCNGPQCHDSENSPESRLVGCAIQTCPEKVKAANPLTYITLADPPILILHGGSDPLVPHNQGEQFYMALNKACKEAIFLSLPKAGHGNWNGFLTDDSLREAATMRSTSGKDCSVVNPTPYQPTWRTVIEFLDRYRIEAGHPTNKAHRHTAAGRPRAARALPLQRAGVSRPTFLFPCATSPEGP
ncbi:MAG: prolyl oligopeptidase family serine peptidase [Paludibaculum sp.]